MVLALKSSFYEKTNIYFFEREILLMGLFYYTLSGSRASFNYQSSKYSNYFLSSKIISYRKKYRKI